MLNDAIIIIIGLWKNIKINIFAGPLIDNTGKEIIPAGKALDDGALWGMNYYLKGVNGKVPG